MWGVPLLVCWLQGLNCSFFSPTQCSAPFLERLVEKVAAGLSQARRDEMVKSMFTSLTEG